MSDSDKELLDIAMLMIGLDPIGVNEGGMIWYSELLEFDTGDGDELSRLGRDLSTACAYRAGFYRAFKIMKGE